MPGALHSELWKKSWSPAEAEAAGNTVACGCAVMPAKNCAGGGGIWNEADESKEDIIDETLKVFRAQVFFKNFEIATPADLTMTYLILFTQQCIQTCVRAKDAAEGNKLLFTLGTQDFAEPGSAGFPLGGFVKEAGSKEEQTKWKTYFKDLRQEMCKRVLRCLFNDDGSPNKWWMCFAKKKFLGMELK